MQLDLSDSEVNALVLALDTYAADLREEIYHTADEDMRQSLEDVALALEGVRERLEPGWTAQGEATANAARIEPADEEEPV